MRRPILLLPLLALAAPAALGADKPTLHGVEVADIDTKARPCDDFFQYANGAWRAANPIPPSMARWSRRWAGRRAGQGPAQGDPRRGVCEEGLAGGQRRAAHRRLLRRLHGRSAVNAAGAKPVAPLLRDIDAITDVAGVAAHDRPLPRARRSPPRSRLAALSDNHEPTHVIAHIYRGRPRPSRPRLLREDRGPLRRRPGTSTRPTWRRRSRSPGCAEAQAKTAADTVFAFEKQLAEASLDNVALRDPAADRPQDAVRRAAEAGPAIRLGRLLRQRQGAPGRTQRARAEVPPGGRPPAGRDAGGRLEDVPQVARSCDRRPPSCPPPSPPRDFGFYQRYLGGAKEMKPRWKRCVESTDDLLGEALGRKYVEKYFPPEAKARMQELVKNLLLAMGDTIRELDLDERHHEGEGAREARHLQPQDRLPRQMEGLQCASSRAATDFWDNVVAGRRFERGRRPGPDRQAGGPRPLGHDAADLRTPTTTRSSTRSSSPPASCSRPPSASMPPTR